MKFPESIPPEDTQLLFPMGIETGWNNHTHKPWLMVPNLPGFFSQTNHKYT